MSNSPVSQLKNLSALLASRTTASIRTSDLLIIRLSKLLSTPAGIDSFLLTLQYTLKFVSVRLHARLESQLALLAKDIANKASGALLPGESVIATVPAPPEARRIAKLAESSKALSGKISDVRTFIRLWGMVGIYAWARSTYLNAPKDPVLHAIAWGQIATIGTYQVMENAVYLAMQGVLNTEGWLGDAGAERKARWMRVSCQFWAAYIALDFTKLGYEWYKESSGPQEDLDEKEVKLRKKQTHELWWRTLIKQAAYAPMSVHYGLESGIGLSDGFVGALGMVSGFTGIAHLWRQTA